MYEDEVNDNAGFEQSSDPAPIAEQSPAQDEWIQPEDFPWEKGEREEARTSTTTPDPDDSQQQEVDPTARTEEAAPSGQEEDKTDEEKKLDEEIQRLQAENPTGLPKHLRSVAQGALRGKRNAEAQVAELTQQLESQSNTLFRPTLPAEEFVAQGKPKEFWDNIAKEYPGYYEPMVNDVLRAHLDPQRLQANPDSAPPVLFDIFANQWLPISFNRRSGWTLRGSATSSHSTGQADCNPPHPSLLKANNPSPPSHKSPRRLSLRSLAGTLNWTKRQSNSSPRKCP
jgi:hypothetical protein